MVMINIFLPDLVKSFNRKIKTSLTSPRMGGSCDISEILAGDVIFKRRYYSDIQVAFRGHSGYFHLFNL
jgi:hypothetical protein